jgi:Domain of unknown function (DUF4166)
METQLCLMQHVLGDAWGKLPSVIQRHYQITAPQHSVTVTGTLSIDYPVWIKPILMFTRLMGALIDVKGDNNQVTVQKWQTDNPDVLYWQRDIFTEKGTHTVFASRMEYQNTGELIEFVGGGFGIRLKLSVENGTLVYRSQTHLFKLGKWLIPIPDWLALGQALITEKALSNDSFLLDFRIVHPLWGETYRYGGVFDVFST